MSEAAGATTGADELTLYNLPRDIYDVLMDFLDDESLDTMLALSPNITVSKYLLQQRQWRQKPMKHWAGVGDLKAVQFLMKEDKKKNKKCPPEAMDWASLYGHLPMVQYLHSLGATCTDNAMNWACRQGHLAVVQFLHSIGAPYSQNALEFAGTFGHLAVVEFLIGIGAAAIGDGLSMALIWACRNGHLPVVRYLHETVGEPWSAGEMDCASHDNQLAVVEYLHKSLGATCTHYAMDWASKNAHLTMLKYLHSIGATPSVYAMMWARELGHLEVVQFLRDIDEA